MTDAERLPWPEQLALDDESYREQVAYLLERSPFYREKLAGFDPHGLAEISELPLTEKTELRATVTPENPFGAHLCASPDEIVRIYSTSGTTGTPSFRMISDVCRRTVTAEIDRESAISPVSSPRSSCSRT